MRPKFKAGQSVSITSEPKLKSTAPKGRYRIVRALPAGDESIRYRVKSDIEPFERIVDERHLSVEESAV